MRLSVEVSPLSSCSWVPPSLPALLAIPDGGRKASCWTVTDGSENSNARGIQKAFRNPQQLCEPPEKTLPLGPDRLECELRPPTFQLLELYQKLSEPQFIAIWSYPATTTNQDSERIRCRFVGSSPTSTEMSPCDRKHPQDGFRRLGGFDAPTHLCPIRWSAITNRLLFSSRYLYPSNMVSKVDEEQQSCPAPLPVLISVPPKL